MTTKAISSPHPLRLGVVWEVAIIWFVGFIALVAMSVLIFGAIQQSATDNSLRERYRVALFDLRENLETNLSLGFDLAANPTAQTQIEQMLGRDNSFQAVEIFDRDGIAVFSTDRGSIGEKVPDRWQGARAKAPDGWTVKGDYETVVGIPIKNSFNENSGFLALTYSVSNGDWSPAVRLTLSVLIGSVILISLLTMYWVGRGYERGQTLSRREEGPEGQDLLSHAEHVLADAELRLDKALQKLSEDSHEA